MMAVPVKPGPARNASARASCPRRAEGLISGLRAVRAVREPCQERIRVGLQPGDLTEPARFRQGQARWRPAGLRAAARRPQRVQAAVCRDLVQPGAQRGTLLEAGQVLPSGQQLLLQRVLGVLQRTEQPVAVRLQLTPVRCDELTERVMVSGLRPFEQPCTHSHDHPVPVGCAA